MRLCPRTVQSGQKKRSQYGDHGNYDKEFHERKFTSSPAIRRTERHGLSAVLRHTFHFNHSFPIFLIFVSIYRQLIVLCLNYTLKLHFCQDQKEKNYGKIIKKTVSSVYRQPVFQQRKSAGEAFFFNGWMEKGINTGAQFPAWRDSAATSPEVCSARIRDRMPVALFPRTGGIPVKRERRVRNIHRFGVGNRGRGGEGKTLWRGFRRRSENTV